MQPIKYQVVGEEDFAYSLTIGSDGEYRISGGTYASDRPRSGKLSSIQETEILNAILELGIPEAHPMPDDAADAFKATLVIGEGSQALEFPFWEGALQEDSRLLKLVRLLETL